MKISKNYLISTIFSTFFVSAAFPVLAETNDEKAAESGGNAIDSRVTELEQADQDGNEGIQEEVVITGTRTRGRTVDDSPVPIDSFSAQELDVQAHGDMTENIKNLVPSFSATALTGDGSAFIRSTSLRGLPPDDVLLLTNSKRRHRSSLIQILGAAMSAGAHAADMGPIPSIALKNVEVLRDGAASQYGSDAIAGVINFLYKDDSEGGEVQVQYGQFYEGEHAYKIAANVGFALGGEGFLNLSAEWVDNDQLERGTQRPGGQALVDAGVPGVGADSPYGDAPFVQTWGRPENDGFRTAWNAGIPVGDDAEVYMFGNKAETTGVYRFFWRPPGHATLQPVPVNPTDPSEGNFCWCDGLPAGYTPYFEGKMSDFSTVLGLRGELASGTLYDVSFGYGENEIDYTLFNTLNLTFGPDSPRDFDTGDLKEEDWSINLDFAREISDSMSLGWGFENREEKWSAAQGDDFSWMAGPWIGIGDLVNPDTGSNYATPPIGSNGRAGFTPDSSGSWSRVNWAAYVDAEWELSDRSLVQAALRYEDFDDFGSTTNGKVAMRYDVSDTFTLRGAISTGFRAPTPGQANIVIITTTFDGITLQQVQQGTIRPTDPLAVENGGKALDAEESTNFSFGFNTDLTDELSLSMDFYRIDVDNRIAKTQFISVDNPSFSELSFYTNSMETETTGIDIVATYSHEWANGSSTDFTGAYNFNDTDITGIDLVNGINPISDQTVFNIENNLPEHRASLSAIHSSGPWTFVGRAHYYGEHFDERGPRDRIKAATLVDLEVSYDVNENTTLILGASNVFDEYPNEIDTRRSQGLPYPRRTAMGYDGGMWYLRGVQRF